MPWNEYGEVRGLNAPPRSTLTPAAATACAASCNCSRLSTAQGPAMRTTSRPPRTTPGAISTVLPSGWSSRLANLKGWRMGMARSTPARASNAATSSGRSSPMTPRTMRSAPRETWARKPSAATRLRTPPN